MQGESSWWYEPWWWVSLEALDKHVLDRAVIYVLTVFWGESNRWDESSSWNTCCMGLSRMALMQGPGIYVEIKIEEFGYSLENNTECFVALYMLVS